MEFVADNGQEGLLRIKECRPDLVITDIKMPVMDGLEMLGSVQEEGIFPKVIVLTAYSEFTYAQQAVRLGVNDYIIKPVVVQEFVQTIRKIQNLYEQEKKRTPDTMGSLEHIVSGILYGVSAPEGQVEEFLDQKYGIGKDTPVIELLTYMGGCFENGRDKKRRDLCSLLDQKEIRYCLIDMEYSGADLCVSVPAGNRTLVSEPDSSGAEGSAGVPYQLWDAGSKGDPRRPGRLSETAALYGLEHCSGR